MHVILKHDVEGNPQDNGTNASTLKEENLQKKSDLYT